MEPQVNQEVVAQLKDMGFGHDRAVRAVRLHHASSIYLQIMLTLCVSGRHLRPLSNILSSSSSSSLITPIVGEQVHFSGNSTIEGAMNWLEEHQTDVDIDQPLRLPKQVCAAPLPCVDWTMHKSASSVLRLVLHATIHLSASVMAVALALLRRS